MCFSAAIMLKLNFFPLWAGFCLVIFCETIGKKQFVQLLRYVFGFCLGIAIVFVPIFAWLGANGITNYFWELVVLSGAARGFNAAGIRDIYFNFYRVIDRSYSFFPLFFGLFQVVKQFGRSKFFYYLGYTVSYALTLLFLSFTIDDAEHFNALLFPHFAVAFAITLPTLYRLFPKNKARNALFSIFLCLLFSQGLTRLVLDLTRGIRDTSGAELISAGKIVDQHTRPGDTIIQLGVSAYIYTVSERDIASRFFYQGAGLNYMPGAREDFIRDILTGKPAIIVEVINPSQRMEEWHAEILQMVEREYRLLAVKNRFNIFIRRHYADTF
jgi:hypothetical protein